MTKPAIWLLLGLLLWIPAWSQDQPIRVRALIEKAELYEGESMVFRIQVDGATGVDQPKIPTLDGIDLQFVGGTDSSQRSISIVNGQRTDRTLFSYHLNYHLVPSKTGELVIPAIPVVVEGLTYQTNAIRIRVKEAEKTDDLKLFVSLSQTDVYLGEPVDVTVTFAFNRSVREFSIDLPFLEDQDLAMEDLTPRDRNRQMHQVNANGQVILMREGEKEIGGVKHATLYFKKRIYPQKVGTYSLAGVTASCEAMIGQKRNRDPFGDFFSMGRDRGIYKRVHVNARSKKLTVKPLPGVEQPEHFSGNIGDMAMTIFAQPTEVKVGDPITLTMTLSGPRLPHTIKPPDLNGQENLVKDFKIPAEIATGEVKGKAKVYVQTLRAKRDDVTEIPGLELSYFDPKEKTYKTLVSDPIPITVQATRVVTAWDAEGVKQPEAENQGSRPESLAGGIAANYYGEKLLTSSSLSENTLAEPPLLWVWLAPVLFFLLALLKTLGGRKNHYQTQLKKQQKDLENAINQAEQMPATEACGVLLAGFLDYLAAACNRPAVASVQDVADKLRTMGLTAVELATLRDQVDTWEGARYGGIDVPVSSLTGEARDLAKSLIGRLS